MVLIAVCVVPFQIELQLENYVLELGLGGAFPIDNQLGKYGFKAWFGGAPLPIENHLEVMALKLGLGGPLPIEKQLESYGFDRCLWGPFSNRAPIGKWCGFSVRACAQNC